MGSFLTGKILPSASTVQKVLHPERRPGRPDLHRDHRAHQADLQLQAGEKCPPGHLRRQVYRKCNTIVTEQTGFDAENHATFGKKWTIFFHLGGHRYVMMRNTSYTIEVSPLIILHFPLLAP